MHFSYNALLINRLRFLFRFSEELIKVFCGTQRKLAKDDEPRPYSMNFLNYYLILIKWWLHRSRIDFRRINFCFMILSKLIKNWWKANGK